MSKKDSFLTEVLKTNFTKDYSKEVKENTKNQKISKKVLLNEMKERDFRDEIENDVAKVSTMLERTQNPNITDQEKESTEVFKRAMLIIASGNLQLKSNDKDAGIKSAVDNQLPLASYLSHGARTMIQVPAGSDDSLFNWLTSGDKNKLKISEHISGQEAFANGNNVVYRRLAGTHAVKASNNDQVKEKKGLYIGIRDTIKNIFTQAKKTKHFGVDLMMDVNNKGKDSYGNSISTPDGEHGHLYIHYQKPTTNKPGAILIGQEASWPGSPNHSKLGRSDPLSPTQGCKFKELETKAGKDQDITIPKKYGGMLINLTTDQVQQITDLNSKHFNSSLAKALPQKNVENIKEIRNQNKLSQGQQIQNNQQRFYKPFAAKNNNKENKTQKPKQQSMGVMKNEVVTAVANKSKKNFLNLAKRIGNTIKNCSPNPFKAFSSSHSKNNNKTR
jgi:hypothetical protein